MTAENFYSTLAQTMASLVALYGIFAVFRWQVLEQQICSAHEALKSYIKQNIPRGNSSGKIHEVEMWLGKDVIPNLRREIYNAKNTDHLIPLCDYYLEITRLEDFKKYLFVMVFWSSFVPFSFLWFSMCRLTPSFIGFIIVFICLPTLFYWLIRLILRALKGKEPIFINNDDTNRQEDRVKFSKASIENIIIELLKSKGINKNPFKKSTPDWFDRLTTLLLEIFYPHKD